MWDIKLKATNEQTRQTKTHTHNSMMVPRGKGGLGLVKGKQDQIYGGKRRLDFNGKHTMPYTDGVSQNCMPETCIILLANVTSKKKK